MCSKALTFKKKIRKLKVYYCENMSYSISDNIMYYDSLKEKLHITSDRLKSKTLYSIGFTCLSFISCHLCLSKLYLLRITSKICWVTKCLLALSSQRAESNFSDRVEPLQSLHDSTFHLSPDRKNAVAPNSVKQKLFFLRFYVRFSPR